MVHWPVVAFLTLNTTIQGHSPRWKVEIKGNYCENKTYVGFLTSDNLDRSFNATFAFWSHVIRAGIAGRNWYGGILATPLNVRLDAQVSFLGTQGVVVVEDRYEAKVSSK